MRFSMPVACNVLYMLLLCRDRDSHRLLDILAVLIIAYNCLKSGFVMKRSCLATRLINRVMLQCINKLSSSVSGVFTACYFHKLVVVVYWNLL